MLKAKIKNRKAQVFSQDLIVGLSIAIIMFGAMAVAWNRASVRISEHSAYEDMSLKAILISDMLVNEMIVTTPNLVAPLKLNLFVGKSYEEIREMFNLNPNHFYLKLTQNNTIIASKGTESSSKSVASVRRAVIYNGTKALLEFRIKEE